MVRNVKLLIAVLLTAILLGASISTARGVGVGSFDISRPETDKNDQPTDDSLVLKLKNDAVYRGKIYITNLSDKSTSLYLYAADALPARNGGIALRNRLDKKTGLAKWIKFKQSLIELTPRERKIVYYTIRIPAVTSADEYMGGIVAENTEPIRNRENKQFAINVIQRAALVVSQRLPGPLNQKLLFLSFDKTWVKQQIKFSLVLKNVGNVHLDPEAKIRITDFFGNEIDYLKVPNLGTIFPKKTARLSAMWPNPPIIGLFTANAVAVYGNGKVVEQTIRFLIFPWWLLLVFVVLIILIVWSAWRRRLKNRREAPTGDSDFSAVPEEF